MRLRVLLTCKFLPPEIEGGGALTVYALAKALVAEGVDVTILKARSRKDVDPSHWPEFRVYETDYYDRFDFRAQGLPDFYAHLAAKVANHRSYRRALTRLTADERFDLIHAQNHTTALAAASLRKRLGLPIAATLRGHGLWCFVLGKCLPDGSPCSGCVTSNQIPCLGATSIARKPTILPALGTMKGWMAYQTRLVERIDLLLPISTTMAELARPYDRPMRIIPDLVSDVEGPRRELSPETRRALHHEDPHNHLALFAGRLAPNKGLDLLIETAADAPNWLFAIAGGEDREGYQTALERRADELGLENVRFLGWVPNEQMPALYDAADAVVLPFLREEPLSRGMVEALSRGRALAATARGGPLDAIEDGVNGVLFEPVRTSFQEALDRLARADLEAMGRRSREVFEQRFSPRHVVASHLEAYRWMIEQVGAGGD